MKARSQQSPEEAFLGEEARTLAGVEGMPTWVRAFDCREDARQLGDCW